ncbi:MAG TPA: response regulator [Bacillota bacterium]
MFKVMVVDDEPIILDKLHGIIDWEGHGCRIVAETNDSTEALRLAVELQPDIVYSDICMPLMNGIELTEALKQQLPQSVVILISGYDDFNYAQQAIETGVFRYLLKPLNTELFIKVLEEAQQHLTMLEQELQEKEDLKAQIKASLPWLREKFFTDLVNGESSRELSEQQLDFLELDPPEALYNVISVHIDDYASLAGTLKEADFQLSRAHLLNLIQNQLKEATVFLYGFQNKPGELVFVYGIESVSGQDGVFKGLQKAQDSVETMDGLTFSAGLGRLYPGFGSLNISYREALLALEFKLWAGRRAIIPYHDLEKTSVGHLVYHPDYDGFLTMLREGNLEKTLSFIDQLIASFKSQEYASKSFLHLTVLSLVNQMTRALFEFNISLDTVFGPAYDPFQEINVLETLDDIERWLKDLSRDAITNILRHKQDVSKNFVAKAKLFIENNYQDPELNLALVAENVYVSSCYLSHLFKESTGSTVIEYLNKIRIRAAKKLLKETQLKIYEIAEQVGFNDYHYFGIVFKKQTGLAPLEYRDKVQFDNLI